MSSASDKAHGDAANGLEPLACVTCRARKLKCDRTKGVCNRCNKVNAECVYPESRRKPTFKRRNVKELEARLAQVEDYLKEVNKGVDDVIEDPSTDTGLPSQVNETESQSTPDAPPQPFAMPDFDVRTDFNFGDGQLMGLGMSEALPPFEVLEELNNIYFERAHHFIPIVHPGRYFQMFYGNAVRRPPMCLQYAILAIGAHQDEKYGQYADIFYKRAREYASADEMKGVGEHFITIAHAQSWAIIGSYEVKNMLFTRASMSSARAVRLVNMMGLDRIDHEGVDTPPALGPSTSWAETEERRRVLWGVFAMDCHGSISTGWPSLMRIEDIMTRLPASEEAFLSGQEQKTPYLEEIFSGEVYEGFAGTVVICHILKTIMSHVHRAKPSDNSFDLMNGVFWTRHRDLDNKLTSSFMFLPQKFRLPENARDPSSVHMNLNLHAAVICLHHAAIEACNKHNLSESVKRSSLNRLKASAEEIANIVKMTAHHPSIFKSPLCALSMYCATTVYVFMAKHEETAVELNAIDISNLELIFQAMEAIGRTHVMTRAFLAQACLDIERNDLKLNIEMSSLKKYRDVFAEQSNGKPHGIPLLARGEVARHTCPHSVIHSVIQSNPSSEEHGQRWAALQSSDCQGIIPLPSHNAASTNMQSDTTQIIRDLINSECFQPMLSAVSRNVAGPNDTTGNKRKRMSPSPAPDSTRNVGNLGATLRRMPDVQRVYEQMAPSLVGAGLWRAGGLCVRSSQHGSKGADQTNSSASSSPAVGTGPGTGTETQSGSSHTSPGWGLGNTAEENRFDLRPFQDRIATPIWQSTEDTLLNHIVSDNLVSGVLPNDGSDPWGLLTAEVDWDSMPGMNQSGA